MEHFIAFLSRNYVLERIPNRSTGAADWRDFLDRRHLTYYIIYQIELQNIIFYQWCLPWLLQNEVRPVLVVDRDWTRLVSARRQSLRIQNLTPSRNGMRAALFHSAPYCCSIHA